MSHRTLTLRSIDVPSIHKFGVGFDHVLNEMMRMTDAHGQSNYPVYNIVKVTENDFFIEMAVAGFGEGDVKIELDNRILTISGDKETQSESLEYLHKGISDRRFVREFTLAENVEVSGAMMKDGILSISLKRVIPEHTVPKSIDIQYK